MVFSRGFKDILAGGIVSSTCLLACAPNDEVVAFSGNDESGESPASGGRGAQSEDDAAVACRAHCDIVERCPCWEEDACYETCFEDCSKVLSGADCHSEAASYLACTGAISDPCRGRYFGEAFSEDCPEQELALEQCVANVSQ